MIVPPIWIATLPWAFALQIQGEAQREVRVEPLAVEPLAVRVLARLEVVRELAQMGVAAPSI